MGGKFGAVVGGDGVDVVFVGQEDAYNDVGKGFGVFAARKGLDEDEAGEAFDHGEDGTAVACADNGVDFPIAEAGALVDDGGAVVDGTAVADDGAGTGAGGTTAVFEAVAGVVE